MAEELTSFDKFHKEVDTELILEDIFHINQEWVINLPQNIFFKLNIFHLLILENYVFSDALHSVHFFGLVVFNQEYLAKSALADHFYNIEVLECRWLVLVSRKKCSCASSHRLANFSIFG